MLGGKKGTSALREVHSPIIYLSGPGPDTVIQELLEPCISQDCSLFFIPFLCRVLPLLLSGSFLFKNNYYCLLLALCKAGSNSMAWNGFRFVIFVAQ